MERVLGHSEFILGREAIAFEKAWSEFTGARHAIACANGTDAISLALHAAGIRAGDEVIAPSMTFIATIEAIVTVGATPVLAEADPATGSMDPVDVEAKITARTRAVIPVHLYGIPADMRRISKLCRERKLLCIEDAAQAHDAWIDDRHAGTWGDLGTFSFFPGKNLGALGDAGAVVTNDEELAKRLRLFRDHGRVSKYEHSLMAGNCRMDGLQAAFLSVKLPHLHGWTQTRERLAARLRRELAGAPGTTLLPIPAGMRVSNHLFILRHPQREEFVRRLVARGIEARVHYGVPVHRQGAWTTGYPAVSLPQTEAFAASTLSLPCFETMTEDELTRVIAATHEVARELAKT